MEHIEQGGQNTANMHAFYASAPRDMRRNPILHLTPHGNSS